VVENGPLRRPVSPLRGRDRLSTALAFDAITARFEGKFKDQNNNVVSIDGLGGPGVREWYACFGSPNQPDKALFFSAGPKKGHDGLFGTLTTVAAELTEGSDQ
jgi:hypothetical protein